MGDWVILFGKNLFSRPNLLRSKMIAILQCTYKTINLNYNYFLRKSHECALKSTDQCLLFDLNYFRWLNLYIMKTHPIAHFLMEAVGTKQRIQFIV